MTAVTAPAAWEVAGRISALGFGRAPLPVVARASLAAAGAALLLRGVGRFFIQARPDGQTRLLLVAALACAVLLLLRLVTKYRRTYRPD